MHFTIKKENNLPIYMSNTTLEQRWEKVADSVSAEPFNAR